MSTAKVAAARGQSAFCCNASPVVVAKLCDRGVNLEEGRPTKNSKYRRYQHKHPAFVTDLHAPDETALQPLWDWVNSLVAG